MKAENCKDNQFCVLILSLHAPDEALLQSAYRFCGRKQRSKRNLSRLCHTHIYLQVVCVHHHTAAGSLASISADAQKHIGSKYFEWLRMRVWRRRRTCPNSRRTWSRSEMKKKNSGTWKVHYPPGSFKFLSFSFGVFSFAVCVRCCATLWPFSSSLHSRNYKIAQIYTDESQERVYMCGVFIIIHIFWCHFWLFIQGSRPYLRFMYTVLAYGFHASHPTPTQPASCRRWRRPMMVLHTNHVCHVDRRNKTNINFDAGRHLENIPWSLPAIFRVRVAILALRITSATEREHNIPTKRRRRRH